MISLEQYRALRDGAGLVNRSERGRLRLTGTDRRDYLQGLLTNDVAALSPGSGCYACLLTAQGRMIADMYVIETGDAILMDLERAVTARVAGHLAQFVFSEDVEVTDVSGSTAQLGIFGPDAAHVVSRVFESHGAPALTTADLEALRVLENRTVNWGGAAEHSTSPVTIVRRDDLGGLGFDLWIGIEHSDALAAALHGAGALAVDAEAADVCRIENGRPLFGRDMTSDTIPLEAGIEDRAISLTKGCYVGQEVIIRVLHRGQGRVARRLVGLTLDPKASVPRGGSTIRADDREIGLVTSAAMSPALGRPIALGYVHRDFVEPGTEVRVAGGLQPSPAVVTPMPFVSVSGSLYRSSGDQEK
jgi:folate-binding protein YgfZ